MGVIEPFGLSHDPRGAMNARRWSLPLLMVASSASAAPAIYVEVRPSGIFIYANNTENRAYTCSISYVWSHEERGARTSHHVNTTVGIAAKFDGVVHASVSPYVDLRVETPPAIACE